MLRSCVRAVPAAALCAVALAPAAGAFPGLGVQVVSAPIGGGEANGASRNPAVSQDNRLARIFAFESDATNLAPGAGGGTNVYAVHRAPGFGPDGDPWRPGRIELVSVGIGGAPADGPSTRPAVDGTSRTAPRCVAFVSAASNLVPGDTNGRPDAFVRNLSKGTTARVSVDSRGRQSTGSVYEVAIDGGCTRVAFVSDAGDLALRRTRNRSWKSAVTRGSPAGRLQVYVRAIGGTSRLDRAVKGLTWLASASGRAPGDGNSFQISFANNGRALAFASLATNVGPDGNGVADVFLRTFERAYGPRIRGRTVQYIKMGTRPVSGGAGGASIDPAVNVDGSVVAFTTLAPGLIGAEPGGRAQVVQATFGIAGAPVMRLVSTTDGGAPGNGPSSAPTVTGAGSWVLFQSTASDVAITSTGSRKPDRVQDIIVNTQVNNARWILAERGATMPSSNPATSQRGNYVLFERDGQVLMNYVGDK